MELSLPRTLAITAHNLHPICRDRGLIIQLEGNILNQERPDFIAKPVCVKMSLT